MTVADLGAMILIVLFGWMEFTLFTSGAITIMGLGGCAVAFLIGGALVWFEVYR